ncbi:sensor histidine kinase [Paenibacillus sp. IHBB 10380]|uniref:sensor histidine kinase n=1 Tax=Paenibacillus sp. IHBB 10380 TaxID=1566358 RepID=UPI0005CF9499|nr:HAMP domain-containing sensor histidine kinase [Paenibacillus sp. IHBB 10380]AJS58841.1 histidine kinase [Paenibacillus sp. IHBB 10380]
MKKQGVTFKLFAVTVSFFLCFYGLFTLGQLLFFENFYQYQKINRVESSLKKFSNDYARANWDSERVSTEAAKVMTQNKNHLAIVTLDGKVKFDDPYHIKIKQDNGQLTDVSISLFMSQYREQFMAAQIRLGDQLDVEGEKDGRSSSQLLYPIRISKEGGPSIGSQTNGRAEFQTKQVSGKVVSFLLPNRKALSLRQGMLLMALEDWFPLSEDHMRQLQRGVVVKEEWTEPWSGMRNIIVVQPIQSNQPTPELIFSVTSLQEISEANEALRWFYLYLGIGGVCIMVIMSFMYSKMVTKPLISINQVAKRMAKLDFTTPTPVRRNDEFGSLSDSLHTLSRTLDSTLHELKEANRQLVVDMEQKQKMERIQQDFFSSASHELKTPLSIIKGFAEGLHDGVSAGKQDHYIQVIIEESEKMEVLVKDMLDLAKLESGTVKLRKTPLLLSDLVEEVVAKLVHLLKDKQLQAIVIPTNEMPIQADVGRLEQVIFNMIVNAIRYAELGSSIMIRIQSSKESTMFAIENKGIHIPEEQLELVWERFYRAEPSRNREMGGTGIGLSIVKHILDLHRCRYAAENIHEGVRFVVWFED